jgi:hypothetical protein
MNEKFLDPKTKVLISNQRKNYIDIDSPGSSSSSSEQGNNSDFSDHEE